MSENNSDLGAFLAGFVIGGLIGAATALVLAPQSGQDTRSQIATKSGELRQAGGQQVQQYREAASNYTQPYRDQAGEAFSNTRSRVQETGGRVQEQARIVLDSGKERAAKVRDQVSSYTKKDSSENGDAASTS